MDIHIMMMMTMGAEMMIIPHHISSFDPTSLTHTQQP